MVSQTNSSPMATLTNGDFQGLGPSSDVVSLFSKLKRLSLDIAISLYPYCLALEKLFELILRNARYLCLERNGLLRRTTALPAALIFHTDLQPDTGFNSIGIPLPGRICNSPTLKQHWLNSLRACLLQHLHRLSGTFTLRLCRQTLALVTTKQTSYPLLILFSTTFAFSSSVSCLFDDFVILITYVSLKANR